MWICPTAKNYLEFANRRLDELHEFSIASGILDTVEETIGTGKHLMRVKLTLGPLSGISADSLEFCFTEIARIRGQGTPVLEILRPRVQAVCSHCAFSYEVDRVENGCPGCGSLSRHITGGFECEIESVTFEEMDIHDTQRAD